MTIPNYYKIRAVIEQFSLPESYFAYETMQNLCKSLPGSGDFRRLPITFADSLDPDQARQNVGPGFILFDTDGIFG